MTANVLLLTVVFLPFASAFAAYNIGRKNGHIRDIFVFAAVGFTFAVSLLLALSNHDMDLRLADWGSIALHFRTDGFRLIYVCVTAFLWLITTIFSPEYFSHSKNTNRYWFFNLITFGAVVGVFFSADFRTTFLFFEIMSFSSYALVAHEENPKALRAAQTLLTVSIICGLVQLMGIWILHVRFGTLQFARLYEISLGIADKSPFYLPGFLMLIGFGAKAGMFPLHIWLPKAHPVAPAPASALLSGILTKTGVFGIVVLSGTIFLSDLGWGLALLIPAVITMVLGAALGVFSNDLKRTLACSSVSQIGFIITGIAMLVILGEYNALAARGTMLHMLNHSLFKLILFVTAGVVYINRHELHLNRIRGFGRGKPLFSFAFIMAALGITGVPLWSGFISKTLLKKSLSQGYYLFEGASIEYLLRFSYWAMIITGGLTFAYMMKLFVTLFVERDINANAHTHEHKRYLSIPSSIALAASAALVWFSGIFTGVKDYLADWGKAFFHGNTLRYGINYLEWANISGALTSIAIGAGIYFAVVRGLLMRQQEDGKKTHIDLLPPKLDLEDSVYRPCLNFLARTCVFVMNGIVSMLEAFFRLLPSWADALTTILSSLPMAVSELLQAAFKRADTKSAALRKDASFKAVQINQHLQTLRAKSAMAGNFQLDLFFLGAGAFVTLIFMLAQALR